MMRSLLTVLLVGFVAMSVSCSSKKKAADSEEIAGVSSEPMSFDPAGSDSGSIQGLNTVTFEYDKSTLTSETRRVLSENANWMNANGSTTVQIEGHCDSRGSVEYNLALGEKRAISVKNYLVSLGVKSDRLKIISYGKEKPLVEGDSESAFSKNRRANFVPMSN